MRAPLSLKARALGWIAQREHSRLELERKLLQVVRQQRRVAERARAATDRSADGLPAERHAPADGSDVIGEHVAGAGRAADAAADVAALLDWLVAHDLLNAERFVDIRIAARAQRFGTLRIEHELAQHGLQADDGALQRLRETELARARALWRKRFGAAADGPRAGGLQAEAALADPAPPDALATDAAAASHAAANAAPADAAARAKQMRFLMGRGFGSDVARRVVNGSARNSEAADDD